MEEAMGSIDIYMFVCHSSPMKKTTMVRTTIYLPKQLHRALKMLAARESKSMADLLRESVIKSYKEDMADIDAADEAMREYRKNPKSAVTIESYLAKRH